MTKEKHPQQILHKSFLNSADRVIGTQREEISNAAEIDHITWYLLSKNFRYLLL